MIPPYNPYRYITQTEPTMKFSMASAALCLVLSSSTVRAFTASAIRSSGPAVSAIATTIAPSHSRSFATTTTRLLSTTTEETTEATTTTEDIDYDGDDTSIYTNQADELTKLKSTFLQTMRDRGFLHQCTNIAALDEVLSKSIQDGGATSAYLGFDATADSLHVGSLLQIMILRHLQKSGHRPVVLVGGGTSKVGDPTGKDESRVQLTDEIIAKNTAGISKVFEKFLTFEGDETATGDAK